MARSDVERKPHTQADRRDGEEEESGSELHGKRFKSCDTRMRLSLQVPPPYRFTAEKSEPP